MNNRPRNTDRNDENIDQLKAPPQTHMKQQDFNRKESTGSFNKPTGTGWGLFQSVAKSGRREGEQRGEGWQEGTP